MKNVILIFSAGLLVLTSCNKKKNSDEPKFINGTLQTSSSACNWLIELDSPDENNNIKVIPSNIEQFKVTLSPGQRVRVDFDLEKQRSTCASYGAVVKLNSASDL